MLFFLSPPWPRETFDSQDLQLVPYHLLDVDASSSASLVDELAAAEVVLPSPPSSTTDSTGEPNDAERYSSLHAVLINTTTTTSSTNKQSSPRFHHHLNQRPSLRSPHRQHINTNNNSSSSSSVLSLLTLERTYSNSSVSSVSSSGNSETLSSVECSETSSVDENFQCDETTMLGMMATTDMEESTADCNGDGSSSSRSRSLNCETWATMGSMRNDQSQADESGLMQTQSQVQCSSQTQSITTTPTTTIAINAVTEEIVVLSDVAPSTTQETQTQHAGSVLTADVAGVTTPLVGSDSSFTNNSNINLWELELATTIPLPLDTEDIETESSSSLASALASTSSTFSPSPQLQRRSSLSKASPHACSTCYLYAPSTSVTFYMDAWLNQQHDFHLPKPELLSPVTASAITETPRPKKKVSWPTTEAAMKTIIPVERWIERGVHAYPNPAPRSSYSLDDSDDSDDDSDDIIYKQLSASLERANNANRGWMTPRKPINNSAETSDEDDRDSVGSATSIRADPAYKTPEERVGLETTLRSMGLTAQQLPSRIATPSLSSSSSVSDTSTTSSSDAATPAPATIIAPKPQSARQRPQLQHCASSNFAASRQTSPSHSRSSSPVTTPTRRKFASGVKVTVIGGPTSADSEHEMAVRIRGSDPIRHRSMIENYWQY